MMNHLAADRSEVGFQTDVPKVPPATACALVCSSHSGLKGPGLSVGCEGSLGPSPWQRKIGRMGSSPPNLSNTERHPFFLSFTPELSPDYIQGDATTNRRRHGAKGLSFHSSSYSVMWTIFPFSDDQSSNCISFLLSLRCRLAQMHLESCC
jgi:hypothetical protein